VHKTHTQARSTAPATGSMQALTSLIQLPAIHPAHTQARVRILSLPSVEMIEQWTTRMAALSPSAGSMAAMARYSQRGAIIIATDARKRDKRAKPTVRSVVQSSQEPRLEMVTSSMRSASRGPHRATLESFAWSRCQVSATLVTINIHCICGADNPESQLPISAILSELTHRAFSWGFLL
jgi:hypothetical protein